MARFITIIKVSIDNIKEVPEKFVETEGELYNCNGSLVKGNN
jgi:uncharacterized protein YhfF